MDEAIIELMRAGRPGDSMARLVPAYRRRVFGLAYGILRDRAAAEDVAQEVFVKVWQAFDSYDGRARLSTWIYAITRNAAIGALRKRSSLVSLSDPDVSAMVESMEARDTTADGSDPQLWRLVDALPEKQREAVVQSEHELEATQRELESRVRTERGVLVCAQGGVGILVA